MGFVFRIVCLTALLLSFISPSSCATNHNDNNDDYSFVKLTSSTEETLSNLRAAADPTTVNESAEATTAITTTASSIDSLPPVNTPLNIVEDSYTVMGMKQNFFEDGVVPVTVTLSDLTYDGVHGEVTFITTVANSGRVRVQFVPEIDGKTFTITNVSPGASTLMMGSPAQMAVETKLSEFMSKIYAFRLIHDGQTQSILFMSGMGFSQLTFEISQSSVTLRFPIDVDLLLDSSSYFVDGVGASFDHIDVPVSIELTSLVTANERFTMTLTGKVVNTHRFDIELIKKSSVENVHTVVAVYPVGSTRIGTSVIQSVAERKLNDFIGRMYEMQLSDGSSTGVANRIIIRSHNIIGIPLEAAFVREDSSASPIRSLVMDPNSYRVRSPGSIDYTPEPITQGPYPPVPMTWKKSSLQHTWAHTIYEVVVTPADQFTFEIRVNDFTGEPTARFISSQRLVPRLTFQQSEVQTKVVAVIRDVSVLAIGDDSITFTSPSAMLTFLNSVTPFTGSSAGSAEGAVPLATTEGNQLNVAHLAIGTTSAAATAEANQLNARRRLQSTSMQLGGSSETSYPQGSEQGSTSMTPANPTSVEEKFLLELPLSIDAQSYTIEGQPTNFFQPEERVDVTLSVREVNFDGSRGSISFVSRILNIQIFNMEFTSDNENEDGFTVTLNRGGISSLALGSPSHMNAERNLAAFMDGVHGFRLTNNLSVGMKGLLFYSRIEQGAAQLQFTNVYVSTPTNGQSGSTSMQPAIASRRLQGATLMTLEGSVETSYPQGGSSDAGVIVNGYPNGETTWTPSTPTDDQLASLLNVPLSIDAQSYAIMATPTNFFETGEVVDVTLTVSMVRSDGIDGQIAFATKVANTQTFDSEFKSVGDGRSFALTAVFPGASTRMLGTPAQSAAETTLSNFMHRIFGFILVNDETTGAQGILFFSKLPQGLFAQLKFLAAKTTTPSIRHLLADPTTYKVQSNSGIVRAELFERSPFSIPMTWAKAVDQPTQGFTIYDSTVSSCNTFSFSVKVNNITNSASSTFINTEFPDGGQRCTFQQSEVQQKIFDLFQNLFIVNVLEENVVIISRTAQLFFNDAPNTVVS